MDARFLDYDVQLKQAYHLKDVNGAWALWSDIVENSFIDCVVGEEWWVSERERKKYRGRGKPNFQVAQRKKKSVNTVDDAIFSGNLDREAARCRAQQRRCLQHGQRIASICGSMLGERGKVKQRTLNADTLKLIKKHGQTGAEDEKDFLEAIDIPKQWTGTASTPRS